MKNNPTAVLFPFQNLDVYRVTRELVVLVEKAGIKDKELRDQATRAAKSTLLRLAEGLPHFGAGLRGITVGTALTVRLGPPPARIRASGITAPGSCLG